MVGVLLAGMKYYHQATGDPRAADVLVRAARWLARETYDPGTNQFRYTSCPNSAKPSSTPSMACEGFAYAARLTGAADLVKLSRDVTKDLVARTGGSVPARYASCPGRCGTWTAWTRNSKRRRQCRAGCAAAVAAPTATYAVAAGAYDREDAAVTAELPGWTLRDVRDFTSMCARHGPGGGGASGPFRRCAWHG